MDFTDVLVIIYTPTKHILSILRDNGTFKKFIPFDGQPYHIPRIIYDYLCERECSVFYNVRDRRNGTIRRAKLIKEFAIDVLPPLTPKELEDLRRKQAMKQGKD